VYPAAGEGTEEFEVAEQQAVSSIVAGKDNIRSQQE
jgi:hypothetical protein